MATVMANKRAAPCAVPVVAKRAKVDAAAHEPQDPLASQFAPIIAAIAEIESMQNVEMLRLALPKCAAAGADRRHKFQAQVLDFAATASQRLEDSRRMKVEQAEAIAADRRAEAAAARAAFEAAEGLASTKKDECDAKHALVQQAAKDEDAARLEVVNKMREKGALVASKTSLVAVQDAFQKFIESVWEPLKASAFAGKGQWRKREKVFDELVVKIKELSLEESLVEALVTALKLKPEQRTAFARTTFQFVEEAFDGHKVRLAECIAFTGAEEEACEKTIADAEAKLSEVANSHAGEDKEYDDLQNEWADLATSANQLKESMKAIEVRSKAAAGEVESRQADLGAARVVSASLGTFKDPTAAAGA